MVCERHREAGSVFGGKSERARESEREKPGKYFKCCRLSSCYAFPAPESESASKQIPKAKREREKGRRGE